ncbi:MAG: GTPase domain-containing protein [Chloroflexota bacterium]
MFINPKSGEITLKVVYYGPARSGKTTNLEYIHQRIPQENRGKLVSMKTQEDRTLFFDYMQMEVGTIRGFKPKFNLYTVPGQVQYESTRKLVLRGADAVVFVADSQKKRLEANMTAYRNMTDHLHQHRISISSIPIVFQLNKCDMPDALQTDFLKAFFSLDESIPCFEASAITGKGVIPTLRTTIKLVIAQLQATH